ncbi:hypothetical protein E3Q17_00844 [Wallemia mellicola]|uniref:ER membrane protein complex subunit 1 n=1 Tax=Wallemia mellicola TaxID=1708541 RepID=A0A4T0N0R1_9BASI|nr:hypothetical protein E3Q21_00412 [Wallemia mellicola]TIB92454.1 hypothetical protein E3Q20_00268 [Wallemia mellicola]TIC03465.1 hypothetical protein E3Q17_00844 [Wallemia mellicola]TIC43428.1 hypothetical protein E3Q07_00615 [Wallemia mellicola]TIC45883.1 hypothetical protein E3Q08_00963 [Wallemia mellicola]
MLLSSKLDQDVLITLNQDYNLQIYDGHSFMNYWNTTLEESDYYQLDFVRSDDHPIIALNSNKLICLDLLSSALNWEVEVNGYYNLHSQPNGIYLYNDNNLLSIDPKSGKVISDVKLNGHIDLKIMNDYLVSLNKQSKLEVLNLKTLKNVKTFNKPVTSLVNLDLSPRNLFGVINNDDLEVYSLENDSLKNIYTFKNDNSLSHFNGSIDKQDRAFVIKTSLTASMKAIKIDIFTPDGPDGNMENVYTIPFDHTKHGYPVKVIAEATITNSYNSIARIAFVTTSGTFELYQGVQQKWVKEIGLSDPTSMVVVDLPQNDDSLIDSVDNNNLYSFKTRIVNHLKNIKYLPSYLYGFGTRFVTGERMKESDSLVRDLFGYRKILIVGTKYGKLVGLDTANENKILWSRNFGPNSQVTHLFTTREAGLNTPAHVLAIVELLESNGNIMTLAIEVDAHGGPALTGSGSVAYQPLVKGNPMKVIPLDIECGTSGNRAIALIDSSLSINLYPSCKTVKSKFSEMAKDFYYALQLSDTIVVGLTPSIKEDEINSAEVWSFDAPENQVIIGVEERLNAATSSVAQIGPDRKALYKYLNPNAILITTMVKGESLKKLYVVDGVTGQIDRTFEIEDESEGANNVFIDNRIVTLARSTDKDTIMYSKELFTNTEDLEHKYLHTPFSIKAMTPTITRNGISHKDIIVANNNDTITSIPRTYLDPSTPKQMQINKKQQKKNKKNAQQFDLVINDDLTRIPNDPKAILNNDPVIGVKDIKCVPSTQLESTSICVAYGQDIVVMNATPSRQFDVLSENFNKIQLGITIVALSVGLLIVKPIVKAKKLDLKWF